ncbi:hypothetical protein CK203_031792 [Vitis vinifera]|uniref:Uncharacterized protein n=1 Tax=Vitis vinifera TaxID=29760 RepID=A0A438I391_VITVI|nr:hypothetical protein CK203_031792 [Vitis vinifera]
MTDKTAVKAISDVGSWTEDGDCVQINITGAGKDVKLSIAQPPPKKPLEMTIPKQQPVVTENQKKKVTNKRRKSKKLKKKVTNKRRKSKNQKKKEVAYKRREAMNQKEMKLC